MPVPNDYFVEPNTKKQYTPFPEDKYQVMIYDVNPIQELSFKGDTMVDKLEFSFVVLDDKKFKSKNEEGEDIEESTRGRRLWRKVPRSYAPGGKYKASLFFELMSAIERKEISKEELTAVQPNTLIGKQLCVFVSINESWNNVESFLKATEDMEALPTVYDQDESDINAKKPANSASKVEKKEEKTEGNPSSTSEKDEEKSDLPF